MNCQKGLSPIIIVLFIVASALGGYLVYSGKISLPQKQNTQTAKSEANPTPNRTDETANWKTYTNEESRFTFKYPDDWYFKNYTIDYPRVNDVRFFKFSDKEDYSQMMHRGNEQLVISVKSGGDIDELEKQVKISKTMFLNKFSIRRSNGIDIELDSDKKIILSIDRYPDEENVLDAILSTFKFLDQK